MKKEITKYLKEGKQSKITPAIRKVASQFKGNDFEKIVQILKWISSNLKGIRGQEKVLKIFATRNANKVLKDGFSAGCQDDALIISVFARALGIPAKYIAGIDKINPENRGHCVVEVLIDNEWVLINDPRGSIDLNPINSRFYKSHFVIGKGLDSWDLGIKTYKDWKNKSDKLIKGLGRIKL